MKICILGNTGKNINKSYSWFVKTVYQGLLLNDYKVVGFDYKSHSVDQINDFLFDFQPDVLFTHLTFHNHHNKFKIMEIFDNLRSLFDTKIIHTMQDAKEIDRYDGDISNCFDLMLTSQFQNIKKFQNNFKIPVYYWPYSSLTYSQMGIYKKELDFKIPVFPGSVNSHPDRADFIQKLQKIMDIKLIQTKGPEDIRNQTLDFCASTPCILSLSTRYDWTINGYIDVRPWQYLGAGGILICRPHKFQEKIIPNDLYFTFDSYKNPEIVKELWEQIKSMPSKDIYNMKQKAFNFIQKYHSNKTRMQQTMEIIYNKRTKLTVFLEDL